MTWLLPDSADGRRYFPYFLADPQLYTKRRSGDGYAVSRVSRKRKKGCAPHRPRRCRLGKELRSQSSGKLYILVAEDNITNQNYVLNSLEKEGYSAVVVGNGREALASLEREFFDLVLMDLQMPDMDGFEATSGIRARERFTGTRTPIIAVTAYAMSGDRDKCLAAGMDGYISKPIRSLELLETIAGLAPNRQLGVTTPDDSGRTPIVRLH